MSAQPESIEATPRGFRPLRWLLLGVAVIVLLVVLLVTWLLGTQSGVRTALNVLQRISPDTVVVEEVTGRLLGPLQLSNVQLKLPGLEGEIANIKLDWQPSQLFSRVITIDELTLSGVSIKLLPTQGEETTEAFELPESLKAPLDVQLKDVQLADVLLQSGDAQIQIDTLAAGVSWIKTQLKVSQLVAHGPLFDVEANADVDARNSYPLSANATLAGRLVDYAPLEAELKITGDVDAAVLSLDVAEPYDLSVAATLTEVIENLQIDAKVAASPQELASLSATLPAVKPTLTATVSGSFDNLKFEADSALAYGGEDYALKVVGTGKSTGLSVSSLVLDTGAGGLQGNAALDWSDQFSAAVALDGKNIDPAIYVANISGALDMRVRMDMAQSSSGELTANLSDLLIEGELLELPVNATGIASMSGDTITAKNIAIQLGNNNLTIDGSIGRQSDFGWSLALDDVSQFSRLAGLSLAGAVSGSGSYEGGVDNPGVDAEVNTRDLVIDGQIIDTFEFVLNGTRRDHWFSLLVEVPRADLELTGAGDLRSNNQWRYELDELWITHADLNPDSAYHEWLLQEPASGLVSADEIRVQPLCLQHRIPSNGGAACVSASKEQTGALQADVELTRLQLANLNTLLPETVRITGELGGELSWSGVLEETTAALQLDGLSVALKSSDEWNEALTFMPSSINLAPEPSGDLLLEARLPLADSVDLSLIHI